jgi:hypothetical protein
MSSSGSLCRTDISKIHDRDSVVNYVLKYVTNLKDSFSDVSLFAQFIKSTYHEKLLNSFGEFSGNSVKYGKTFIPFSVFKKSQKNYCFCFKCMSIIHFQFDFQISFILNSLPIPDVQAEKSPQPQREMVFSPERNI